MRRVYNIITTHVYVRWCSCAKVSGFRVGKIIIIIKIYTYIGIEKKI